MKFSEIVKETREWLQREGRISYRALTREFELNAEALEDLKEELIDILELAADKGGKMLVWTGDETPHETISQPTESPDLEPPSSSPSVQPKQETPTGERRQLTVMFCDLVGSTALSEQLDPEELQTVVRTYQEVSAQVIERYEGHIAQYLGDGLLVYFGYPAAHEDDAARAIRAGLEIVTALDQARSQFPQPVQVRIGIHTGPVVIGQMGGGSRHEQLALGETPNVAARVQGKAEPNEVVISAATQQLVVGLFETDDRGLHELKGISTPQVLYRVTAESLVQSRFEAAVRSGLTPLVGREDELAFLHQRWTQAQTGNGQAVLVSGEPGIGKSRLMQELRERIASEEATHIAFQCSPYHQNSALYPVTAHLQRLLQFAPHDTPDMKLDKLQQLLGRYRFPQAHTLPLLAALLSLPHPEGVPSLTVSPQKQKEQLQAVLVAWLIEETEKQPVYTAWEDLHWADPSTLEVLDLLLTQVPTTRLLAVLTYRPEFVSPWGTHSYLSQLTLSRLAESHVNVMVERVTGGKALPEEVVQQIVTKTDGVPLFVEELTKTILESGLVRAVNGHYELTGPLSSVAIPATLQDSLMARLDRLGAAKEVVQLGATIGREFSYEILQAVASIEETSLQQRLGQLVAAELVYQRGVLPQASYLFKHALIQDTAYQSILKSQRQLLHTQIAQVLETQFPETTKTQPEVVAHHFTEAGLGVQAIPYWQQAGQRAVERSANTEAVSHFTKGLTLIFAVPDPATRLQQELGLHTRLGPALMAAKGYTAPEVEQTYLRARELCEQLDDPALHYTVLRGLVGVYVMRAEIPPAHDSAQQCLTLATRTANRASILWAHYMCGMTSYFQGEFVAASQHLEQGLTLYNPEKRRLPRALHDPSVACLSYAAWTLWHRGYPDQGLVSIQKALARARELEHPYSMTYALFSAARLHQLRQEAELVHLRSEAAITLATEHDFSEWVLQAMTKRGWALAMLGKGEEGIALLQQGSAGLQSRGMELGQSTYLALLAEVYGCQGQTQEGLATVAEAFSFVDRTRECFYEAELYRLKGELLLNAERRTMNAERKTIYRPQSAQAEECFQTALKVARHQAAKSWELRAATSLARLWQSQGKSTEARELLTPVYHWFTEGFDTADLKDAKTLLDQLS